MIIYLSVNLFGYSQKKYTISGYITDKNNGETIVSGISILVEWKRCKFQYLWIL